MTKRSGSENRVRQKGIRVRLDGPEFALLAAEASRTGRSASAVLREAFLASVTEVNKDGPVEH